MAAWLTHLRAETAPEDVVTAQVEVARRNFEEGLRTNECWVELLLTATITTRAEFHNNDCTSRKPHCAGSCTELCKTSKEVALVSVEPTTDHANVGSSDKEMHLLGKCLAQPTELI